MSFLIFSFTPKCSLSLLETSTFDPPPYFQGLLASLHLPNQNIWIRHVEHNLGAHFNPSPLTCLCSCYKILELVLDFIQALGSPGRLWFTCILEIPATIQAAFTSKYFSKTSPSLVVFRHSFSQILKKKTELNIEKLNTDIHIPELAPLFRALLWSGAWDIAKNNLCNKLNSYLFSHFHIIQGLQK